jgi:hypothetical protein
MRDGYTLNKFTKHSKSTAIPMHTQDISMGEQLTATSN